MGMHNYANTGYIVSAEKLKVLLPKNKQEKYLELLDQWEDGEAVLEFLNENMMEGIDVGPTDMFKMTEDIESEDLEIGTIYAVFEEEDLYQSVPKPELKSLNGIGIKPEFGRWVTWG
jgi:hypothetical protein